MQNSNIYDVIALQRGMLEKTGLWPKRVESLFYKLRRGVSWMTDIVFSVTLIMELSMNLMQEDYKNLTELLSFMASEMSYIFKNMVFLYNRVKFMDAIEILEHKVLNAYPYVLDKHVKLSIKVARIIMKLYQYMVALLVLLYLLKPFFTKDLMAIRFAVYDFGQYRLLYHLYQIYSIGLACWNNSSLDVLALGLISIGAAQFNILRDKLLNLRRWAGHTYEEVNDGCYNNPDEDEDLDKDVYERISECVQHHLVIIDYCVGIENVYTYYFLIQFIDSVVAICNTWFQFMLADDLLNIVFLISYSFVLMMQLGIYCWFGNNLLLTSAEIRDACYMTDWYKSNSKVRKALMLIMERAKRPVVLTAGKFSVLCLSAYMSILQSSYSYFALMNRLNTK